MSATRYLERLRRRAWTLLGVRAALFGLGAGALLFAVAALIVGPVSSTLGAIAAWSTIVVGSMAAAGWSMRSTRALRGSAIARLIADIDPALASLARSAAELSVAPAGSPALVAAHARQVGVALETLPISRVAGFGWFKHRSLGAAALAAAVAIAMLLSFDRGATGAFALLHPGARDAEGRSLADVVSNVRWRLVYPSYMNRSAENLTDQAIVHAPFGTSITLDLKTRIAAGEARVQIGDQAIRLATKDDHSFHGQIVLRESGEVSLRFLSADGWLTDRKPRSLVAIEDQAPQIEIVEPDANRVIEPEERLSVVYEARDDVGLERLQLVIQAPELEEERRDLPVEPADGSPANGESMTAQGSTELQLDKLSLRPGDRVRIWIEASDGDTLRGPKLGRSVERVLTVASEATRRAEAIGNLETLRDQGLEALADRLEAPLGTTVDEARQRHERISPSLSFFLEAADKQVKELGEDDADIVRGLVAQIRPAAERELATYEMSSPSLTKLRRLDENIVQQLEDGVLTLADRLGQARLEDAAEIARELELLRREMVSLLSELRRTNSPEARQRLLAALSRARQRLTDLRARLAALAQDVPGEFLNAEALATEEKEAALDQFAKALESDDLEAAADGLHELERELDALAEALGNAQGSYQEARFGARDRALAEVLDTLVGLENEQRRLAGHSDAVRQRAARRALEASQAKGQGLAELSQATRRALKTIEGISSQPLGAVEKETLDRAAQRVADTRDALASGDLGEARRMAEEASVALQNVTRDLELAALMFPGARGETADVAARARLAEEQVAHLQVDLDRAIPRLQDHVTGDEKAGLFKDLNRQQRVESLAEALQKKLLEQGQGARRATTAADSIADALRAMSVASDGLQRSDPVQAASYQEEAARRLTQAREQLERDQQSPNGDSSGQGGGQGKSAVRDRRRVEIPTAPEDAAQPEIRRQLLDAMRQKAPSGYEEAVRRYYEELLR